MEQLKKEARSFLDSMATDAVASAWVPDITERWRQIESEIDSKGTYTHTYRELQFGCRLAWRNSNRCIGRHFWRTLQVLDARECATQDDAVAHLKRHVDSAFNGGAITNVVTVFPQAQSSEDAPWRMANHQLVRYAGLSKTTTRFLATPTASNSRATAKSKAGRASAVHGLPSLGCWSRMAKLCRPWILSTTGKFCPMKL